MKKKIIISTIIVMGFSVLFHSVYKYIPCLFTSLLFPVNESLWEHGKMIMLSYICLTIIEKIFYKENNSVIFSNLISSLICMILDFTIFGLIYFYILNTKDNMIVTIITYLICIVISLIIKEKFLKIEYNKNNTIISIIIYITIWIIFIIFTYYPLRLPFFYDYNKNIYGISNKTISN